MTTRDDAIISDLQRFRAMTRGQIERMHFGEVENKVNECNRVMLRLKRDGHVAVSKERRMYIYFPVPHIKKDSSKLNHYLAIADFYCEINNYAEPTRFDVEVKLGAKGSPEPDIFMIWKKTLWFVEVQQSVYSAKQWQEKLNRYEKYYLSEEWKSLDWQQKEKKFFPMVWIVGKGPGVIPVTSLKVFHASVDEMVNKIMKR